MSREQIKTMSDIVKSNLDKLQDVKVLEAGCGSATHLKLSPHYKVTGIDISQKQLDRNSFLSEKICGDIQTYPLESNTFDMIVSWFVLEHVKSPRKAVENFLGALKENGLIVLALPSVWSVKGMVAKFTPHVFHIFFYRYVLKSKHNFENDEGPFKTYLNTFISPENLKEFASKNNLEVAYLEFSNNTIIQQKIKGNPIIFFIHKFVGKTLWLVSLGKIKEDQTDFFVVLKKLPKKLAA